MSNYEDIYTLPVIPTRGIVLFPDTNITFDVGREVSRHALEDAAKNHSKIFITAQQDETDEEVKPGSLSVTGTIARISQVMHLPENVTRIIASGERRGILKEILSYKPFIRAVIAEAEPIIPVEPELNRAYCNAVKDEFKILFAASTRMHSDFFMRISAMNNLEVLCNNIAAGIDIEYKKKQALLEENDLMRFSERLIALIKDRVEILKLEKKIASKVKANLDKNQKEYFLREQIRVITEELGEHDGAHKDAEEFREKVKKHKITGESREKLLKDIERFEHMPTNAPESNVLRSYIETVLDLPWNKKSKETFDLNNVRDTLNEDHYGLENVKERVLEYLAVRHFTNGRVSTILCLTGPPGVGKTSVARSVARALNRKYVRISLGGIHDESDIRGHRKTYIGAMEGRIIAAMREAKTSNPLILLDEIDKMGADYKGDPSAALLEVLDYEQNSAFRDHYIEIPFDLSQVLFITTANTTETISHPLLDRMEIVELSGYTQSEKFSIGKQYLVKKALDKNGLNSKQFRIDDNALQAVIDYYTREAGVRKLEQQISALCRKAARTILEKDKKSVRITAKNLESYLGKKRFRFDMMNSEPQIGIARGLAWTSVGGETLSIEVNVMKGSGKTELTGKLGDVMKESALTAISFIRSIAADYGIDENFYNEKDIHIHVPEGAVPKDGPSAGVTIATAVISALSGRAVRNDVAMTGEITLRGRILAIGGLKEKSLAAYRAGIHTVIIPEDNKADIDDIPGDIADKITFIPVKSANEAFDIAVI